jgi:hypothetical protein
MVVVGDVGRAKWGWRREYEVESGVGVQRV